PPLYTLSLHDALPILQPLHELALVVGLEEARLQAQLAPELGDAALQLDVREVPVDLRIAAPQLAEVDPVHDLDAVAAQLHQAAANSRTAATSSCSSTGQPGRASPGASTSTNGTAWPCRRFLSRPSTATIAS